MSLPGFTAEASVYRTSSGYRYNARSGTSQANSVIPAIPFCGNCDYILENCEQNGWRPRAACNACAVGNCFSGVENPPPRIPPLIHPPSWWGD